MRALTVQQPWAWAIVHGGKDVENRTQAWSYRGPLAIHAGIRWSERGAESPLVIEACRRAPSAPMNPEWVTGAIIGVVDLVDVHSSVTCIDAEGAMCSAWAEFQYDEHGGRRRRDIVHLVLEHPRPLAEPIPCKGRLGLWTPPAEVLAELEPLVCEDCSWVEERAMCDPVPRLLLGRPCAEHAVDGLWSERKVVPDGRPPSTPLMQLLLPVPGSVPPAPTTTEINAGVNFIPAHPFEETP